MYIYIICRSDPAEHSEIIKLIFHLVSKLKSWIFDFRLGQSFRHEVRKCLEEGGQLKWILQTHWGRWSHHYRLLPSQQTSSQKRGKTFKLSCASIFCPIFNIFINWRSSYHMQKPCLPTFSFETKPCEANRIIFHMEV